MLDQRRVDLHTRGTDLSRRVRAQEIRRLDARRAEANNPWSGVGVLGRIGWSVAAPTLLGALLGATLDRHRPGAHSWTLILLISGLCLGCVSAWRWVSRENDAMHAGNEPRR